MKTKHFALISSLFAIICLLSASISQVSGTITINSAEEQLNNKTLVYDIVDSNGVVTFWGIGDAAIEVDGTIEVLYNGDYLSWGVEEPHFNMTYLLANGNINTTMANQSNSNLAMTLILGFGTWQPGFFCSNNWDTQDALAEAIANTPESNAYSMNGTLDIQSENGLRIYNYTQNPNNGDQKTLLAYNEENGILEYWESSFYDFHMRAELSDGNTDSKFIPGYPLGIISITSIFVIGVLIFKKIHE